MKLIPETFSCLFRLLLLTELIVQSSSLPTHSSSHCGFFGQMIHQVESLMNLSKKMHELRNEELQHFEEVPVKLENLPDLHYTASHLRKLKVNETLTLLHTYTQSFRLHIDWLKDAKENFSLPFQTEVSASSHLLHLSNLIKRCLHPPNESGLQSTVPHLPVVSTAFETLLYSIEISDRLNVFCVWSKRILRYIHRHS
ncbi:uncharacterized protein il11b [Cyprinodon tularosa]|uniref:uncharacterized protein il11b n=1 Tax=Cyprinodon tularosa TaxID=77115 RepID=UPI0018E2365F|nr:uncharacterized protein il11b [Cyprinodon tularosa]